MEVFLYLRIIYMYARCLCVGGKYCCAIGKGRFMISHSCRCLSAIEALEEGGQRNWGLRTRVGREKGTEATPWVGGWLVARLID